LASQGSFTSSGGLIYFSISPELSGIYVQISNNGPINSGVVYNNGSPNVGTQANPFLLIVQQN